MELHSHSTRCGEESCAGSQRRVLTTYKKEASENRPHPLLRTKTQRWATPEQNRLSPFEAPTRQILQEFKAVPPA
jgi:hypothetical protein